MACYDPYYPICKEDCYWYGEWLDMGARIPYCKCKKEKGTIGPEDCENCAEYHSKYKRTNADKTRSMTDGELAEKIGESIDCEVCKTMHHSESGECPCRPHQSCVDFWLDWLRQEATD